LERERRRRTPLFCEAEVRCGSPAVFIILNLQTVRTGSHDLIRRKYSWTVIVPLVDDKFIVHEDPYAVIGQRGEMVGAGLKSLVLGPLDNKMISVDFWIRRTVIPGVVNFWFGFCQSRRK